jgi:S1-C subfamily serine protease
MRNSIAASILIAAGAADAAVMPDFQHPALEAVADRMHTMAVQVVASGGGEKVNVASGVLAGDGIVLTDLRAVVVETAGGVLEAASEIAVATARGVFPARVVGAALDVDVAVLELPQAAGELEGPPLAEEASGSGDQLLAIRASKQGPALVFEVISFSIEQAEGEAQRLQSTPALPSTFTGAPVFDARGELAGMLVSPNEQDGLFVPAARLRQILARVRDAVPQDDDHI